MTVRSSLGKLEHNRGYVLIASFIVSTLVETLLHRHRPPDPLFMATVACSMYLLFEVGLFFARRFRRR